MAEREKVCRVTEEILDLAKEHAESSQEPDHEVGDLQFAFREAMRRLDDKKRHEVHVAVVAEATWRTLDEE